MVKFTKIHSVKVALGFQPESHSRLTTAGPMFVVTVNANGRRVTKQVCECTCGNVCVVNVTDLRQDNTKSCGCWLHDVLRSKAVTHGESRVKNWSTEYSCWAAIKRRCLNKNVKHYDRYGGRGIQVCERWMQFENFLSDMGRRPTPKHSIERIDNNGNYCKENCRWATASEQARNRRTSVLLTAFGRTQTLKAWSDEYGIHEMTITARIRRLNWSIEKALTTPSQRKSLAS